MMPELNIQFAKKKQRVKKYRNDVSLIDIESIYQPIQAIGICYC